MNVKSLKKLKNAARNHGKTWENIWKRKVSTEPAKNQYFAAFGPPVKLLNAIDEIETTGERFYDFVGKHNSESNLSHLSYNEPLREVLSRESNARTYNRKFPVMINKAEGCILTDSMGNEYLDFLGCAGTLALGHNHPVQVEAIRNHLDSKKPLQLLDIATDAKMNYVDKLFSFLPRAFRDNYRIQFCGSTGCDAVDSAVKLCKIATGRSQVLSFHGAYHGMGQGPLAMMGNLGPKQVAGLMPGVQFLPYPNKYRQPFGVKGEEGDKLVMNYISHLLEDVESGISKPACIVIEVIQGEGGLNSISNWALQELSRIAKRNSIPLVVDEVQSGFCRSGRKFAFEYSGITPDIVVLSKAAGGSQPLSCIVFHESLDQWTPGMHAGTFRGNGLAFAAGAATIDYMQGTELWTKVVKKSDLFERILTESGLKYIGDVRGKGLMMGIELVDPTVMDSDGLPVGYGDLCAQTQVECFKRGLIIERGGRGGAVLRPLPPLTVTESEIRTGCGIILESIEAAAKAIAPA